MKYLLILIAFAAIIFFSGCAKQNAAPAEDNSSIIFFYGQECPHCQKVEQYFKENNVPEKIQFSQREVYHNQSNAALFEQKAPDCGLKQDEIGVPLLWTAEKCYTGDKDIIDFFNSELNEGK